LKEQKEITQFYKERKDSATYICAITSRNSEVHISLVLSFPFLESERLELRAEPLKSFSKL